MKPNPIVAAVLALTALNPAPVKPTVRFSPKTKVKRVKTQKIKKAGRGRPAQGFDPVTNTWIKP
jgi:hypothetical protein